MQVRDAFVSQTVFTVSNTFPDREIAIIDYGREWRVRSWVRVREPEGQPLYGSKHFDAEGKPRP
jgi:hypothetical protein